MAGTGVQACFVLCLIIHELIRQTESKLENYPTRRDDVESDAARGIAGGTVEKQDLGSSTDEEG